MLSSGLAELHQRRLSIPAGKVLTVLMDIRANKHLKCNNVMKEPFTISPTLTPHRSVNRINYKQLISKDRANSSERQRKQRMWHLNAAFLFTRLPPSKQPPKNMFRSVE